MNATDERQRWLEKLREQQRAFDELERWCREKAAEADPRTMGFPGAVVFHRTTREAAESILRDGFRDGRGSYMLEGMTLEGVFVSDVPVGGNEGAQGRVLLRLHLDRDLGAFDSWEIVDDCHGEGFREWCVPATWLNSHSAVTVDLREFDE